MKKLTPQEMADIIINPLKEEERKELFEYLVNVVSRKGNLSSKKDLSLALGKAPQYISQMKIKNRIPVKDFVLFCLRNNIDLNSVFHIETKNDNILNIKQPKTDDNQNKINFLDKALTTDTPTPWSPPETL